jgi:hypothetical protein
MLSLHEEGRERKEKERRRRKIKGVGRFGWKRAELIIAGLLSMIKFTKVMENYKLLACH